MTPGQQQSGGLEHAQCVLGLAPGAVDDSTFLAGRMAGARSDEAKLVDLFSRRVHDRVFYLRAGVWTEHGLRDDEPSLPRRSVEAWSPAYFALLAAEPELGRYLALSDRMLLRTSGGLLEVRPAGAAAPAPEAGGEPDPAAQEGGAAER